MPEQLTLLSGALLAKTLASQERDRALRAKEAAWPDTLLELSLNAVRSGYCGKMCQDALQRPQTPQDGIFPHSCLPCMNSGIVSRGEFLTLNTTECPNDVAACSLSDILERGNVPQKFFLSSQACRGILQRAKRRGKKLPEALKTALEAAQ